MLLGDHRALVALLRSDSAEGAGERAAWTLDNLVHTNADNKVPIVSVGAIEPLVAPRRVAAPALVYNYVKSTLPVC